MLIHLNYMVDIISIYYGNINMIITYLSRQNSILDSSRLSIKVRSDLKIFTLSLYLVAQKNIAFWQIACM